MTIHAVIDIETLSLDVTKPAIMQIGVCIFNLEADKFAPLARESLSLVPAFRDQDTVDWWADADPAMLKHLTANKQNSLQRTVDTLHQLCSILAGVDYVWAKSPSFDLEFLANYFKEYSICKPWNFRQEMCVRTLQNIAEFDSDAESYYPPVVPEAPMVNTFWRPHNGLYDATKEAMEVFQWLKN